MPTHFNFPAKENPAQLAKLEAVIMPSFTGSEVLRRLKEYNVAVRFFRDETAEAPGGYTVQGDSSAVYLNLARADLTHQAELLVHEGQHILNIKDKLVYADGAETWVAPDGYVNNKLHDEAIARAVSHLFCEELHIPRDHLREELFGRAQQFTREQAIAVAQSRLREGVAGYKERLTAHWQEVHPKSQETSWLLRIAQQNTLGLRAL